MSQSTVEHVVATLKTQGAVTLEGVFSAEEMAHFRSVMDRTIEEASPLDTYKELPTDKVFSRQGDSVWNIWEFYKVCEENHRYTRHPAIIRILETLFGEPAVQASAGTSFDKVSGPAPHVVHWHQDSHYTLMPAAGHTPDPADYWFQFDRYHVRPNQLEWNDDINRSTVIIRINVDPQTAENGCLRIIPGSYLEGSFEVKGGQETYIAAHDSETIDCIAGEGSVTFYYPMTLHSSAPNTAPEGTHRRVVGHRMRRAGLTIPNWEWPPDWEWFSKTATPESGFDLNPV